MGRQTINRLSALLPIALSLLALLVVGAAIATGWDRGLKDEGAVAHIFQLLIAAQAPLIVLFLATADWRRITRVAAWLAAQAAALGLAFAPVAAFNL
jgi:hypothetical protein